MVTDQAQQPAEAPAHEEFDEAGLTGLVGELEAGADAGTPEPVQQGPGTAEELRQALDMVRAMARPLFADWQDFGSVWSDTTLQAMAENGGAIMDRHGWTMGGLLSQWGPYIGLAAAVGPAAMATYQHVKLKRARLEAIQRAKQAGQLNTGPAPATAPEEAEGVRP